MMLPDLIVMDTGTVFITCLGFSHSTHNCFVHHYGLGQVIPTTPLMGSISIYLITTNLLTTLVSWTQQYIQQHFIDVIRPSVSTEYLSALRT